MRRAMLLCAALGLIGCHDGEEGADPVRSESFELDVDIRESAQLLVESRGAELRLRLTLSRGFGVAKDSITLAGNGKLERFPEADVALFTAKFAGPPVAGGPCGAEPVSLALALHRRGTARRVSGSLTAYCGKNVWSGVPARNPLRLSTSAPKEE